MFAFLVLQSNPPDASDLDTRLEDATADTHGLSSTLTKESEAVKLLSSLSKEAETTHTDSEGKPRFLCTLCGKFYRHRRTLTAHLREGHGKGPALPFPCQLCDRKFLKEGELQLHVNRHMKVKPFKCERCGKSFASKRTFHPTKHACHILADVKFMCSVCGKEFKTKKYLHEHEVNHSVKRYRCEKCLQSFTHRSQILRHKKKCLAV